MAVTIYKCPSCGAGIEYKPDLGKFKCDYCLSEYTEEEIKKQTEEIKSRKLNSYECKSCGAKVVTDETTTATFCYYCHNPVIISDRLEGDFLPNKIIPFSIDKKKAEDLFMKWAGNKRFVPNDFKDKSQLEKITGMYLPYWWVDSKVNIDYLAEGRNIRVWRVGQTEYTETKKYEIVRQGQIDINNVSELAFTKIDRNLLNGISPFNEKDAIPFTMPYLSGFFAQNYDISREEAMPLIKNQLDRYYSYLVNELVMGYDRVNNIKNNVNIDLNKWNYTLLPAWVLTYRYNNKTYVYAVNGQTGKSFGELPISSSKLNKAFGMIFAITSVVLLLGGMFIW